jgi:hypothetical protein
MNAARPQGGEETLAALTAYGLTEARYWQTGAPSGELAVAGAVGVIAPT